MKTVKAAVVSNGIEGLEKYLFQAISCNIHFRNNKEFSPDLDLYHLLIVPNGSDHIAMHKIKDKVLTFLNNGNTLFLL
jgi:hypothetical protein